jgi:hypothetical protein
VRKELTVERLRELLHYDSGTGVFTRRVDVMCGRNGKQVAARKGEVAGYVNKDGYVMIGIEGRDYRAHRLAWLYVTGQWPTMLIDHKNRKKADNWWDNLREATKQMNGENMSAVRTNTISGLLGAHYSRRHKLYCAKINVGSKVHYLGWHKTAQEAHQAYLEAKRRLHEGCTI